LYSVYGNVHENIPNDLSTPMGKDALLTYYVDANTMILLLVVEFYIVLMILLLIVTQTSGYTVETETYGSEFVATWIATDQIID
jgi:hypothetical protein